MPVYPESKDDRFVDATILMSLVRKIFQHCGMTSTDAELLADTLVMADLRGCHSHGVLRVPEYVKKLTADGVNPRAQPAVVKSNSAAIVVDGHNSMGQIACAYGMHQAMERAANTSVAVVTIRGSNHCGAMAYFAMLPLEQDMIGIAATNALPTMAPWGGCEKIIGINPLAVAIPAGEEHPIVLDAAFSGSSHGKIRVYHQKGLPIPDDWAFDSEGQPTTSAAAAIEGLLQPIGGYKGTGLAVIMGILSSVLSGACYGTELGNMVDGPSPGGDGQFLMVIKVSAFEELNLFKRRIDKIICEIRNSERAVGTQTLYAPGGLEAETEQQLRQTGIPLNAVTIQGLVDSAAAFQIDTAVLAH